MVSMNGVTVQTGGGSLSCRRVYDASEGLWPFITLAFLTIKNIGGICVEKFVALLLKVGMGFVGLANWIVRMFELVIYTLVGIAVLLGLFLYLHLPRILLCK